MTRHDFFKKRLAELGVYDKDSDYGGLIGKWVEELSKTFQQQGQSGMSAEITMAIFNQLMDEYSGKPVTPSPISAKQPSGPVGEEDHTDQAHEDETKDAGPPAGR